MYVLELDDNGEWAGGADAFKVIFSKKAGSWPGVTTGWELGPNDGTGGTGAGNEIEFDSNAKVGVPIPEPATMLLLGTGALGLIGYLRRKRMG